MKFRDAKQKPVDSGGAQPTLFGDAMPPPKPKRRFWRGLFVVVLVLAAILGAVRLAMPWAVRDYVNHTLRRSPLYSGTIGEVRIHLWRGAYSIQDVKLSKTTGNVPVPLFAAKEVDLSIEWPALIHGKIVGQIAVDQPEINFVDSPDEADSQTGGGGGWLQMIQDLFPFAINRASIRNGSVHFRTYQTPKPVDVYLSQFDGSLDNLRNINDETTPLAATLSATATAMEEAHFDIKMKIDPFSYRPTFHLALRLLNLDVTKINDLALAYGKFDFKQGWFDLVLETDSKEGQMTGYVKPLFRNLKVFSLARDLKEDNPLEFFWQALVGAATTLLKNQHRDQFGTLIPFTGEASGKTSVAILTTIGNVFRNAFVRAYLPRLDQTLNTNDTIHFGAPSFSDSISTLDTEQ